MKVTIRELMADDLDRPILIDDRFTVDSVLCLYTEDNSIRYSIKAVPAYEKRYPEEPDDPLDLDEYLDHPDQVVYVADIEGTIAGLVVVKRNWNQYAYVDDIKVDNAYRRLGIGRMLMDEVQQWARRKGLAGIMLETQNNNVGACGFYERYGFVIGGFDLHLYRGIDRDTDEIAIYWYLFLE